MNQKLNEILSSAWAIPEDLSIADWSVKYCTLPSSPYGTKFSKEMSPWLLPALESMKQNKVREIVLSCSAQSAKSTYLYLALAWALSEDPSPCLFYAPTEQLAKEYARSRILPILDSCEKLKHLMPQDRADKLLRSIQFPRGSLMVHPANQQAAQSWSAKYIFCDEVARFNNDGILSQIRARGTMYYDGKLVLASTQEEEDTDFNRAWLRSTQNVFHFRCPKCDALMPPEFEEIVKWETNETTRPNGMDYNFEELAKTVYFSCPSCQSQLENNDANWRSMVGGGEYVSKNPEANEAYQGYRWTALCLPPQIVPVSQLVEEFLIGKREAESGYYGNLKEFVNLRNAKSWNSDRTQAAPMVALEPYDASEVWEDAAWVFLGADIGGGNVDCHWVGVRAFAKNGDSRLIHYSRVSTFEEIEEIRKEFNVKPHCCGIDSGYATYDVYKACAKYGWTALKGEETTRQEGYLHQVKTGRRIFRPYSKPQRVDPRTGDGKRVTLIRHSSNLLGDILNSCIRGRTEAKWLVSDVGPFTPFYLEQLQNEVKKPTVSKKTGRTVMRYVKIGQQHAWDVEKILLLWAIIGGIPVSNRKQKKKAKD